MVKANHVYLDYLAFKIILHISGSTGFMFLEMPPIFLSGN